jgi:hypothetical protein
MSDSTTTVTDTDPANAPPILGGANNLTGFGPVDPALTVADPISNTLRGATVAIAFGQSSGDPRRSPRRSGCRSEP